MVSDAEKACLKRKKNIQSLNLSWSISLKKEKLVSNLGVPEALEPPSEIVGLAIYGYPGSDLPCWMSKHCDSSCLPVE